MQRFRNIPLVFLEPVEQQTRSAPRHNLPLFYYGEQRQISPSSSRSSSKFNNAPFVFLNDEPDDYDSFDDDSSYEVEVNYENDDDDDEEEEVVPPVYKKPAQKPKPSKRPQNNKPRPNRPTRPQKPRPVLNPVAKPTITTTTTMKPVTTTKPATTMKPEVMVVQVDQEVNNDQEEYIISETPHRPVPTASTPTASPTLSETPQRPVPTFSRKPNNKHTIEIIKDNETIEIPIPQSLEIVAFITKDGSIYEIDNGDENVLIVPKDTEKSQDLKFIKEKSLQHTINKVLVDSEESSKPKAVFEVQEPIEGELEVHVVDDEKKTVESPSKIMEVITTIAPLTENKEVIHTSEAPHLEIKEEIFTTAAPVDKRDFPLLRNAN